jgi:hypothetical protein
MAPVGRGRCEDDNAKNRYRQKSQVVTAIIMMAKKMNRITEEFDDLPERDILAESSCRFSYWK